MVRFTALYTGSGAGNGAQHYGEVDGALLRVKVHGAPQSTLRQVISTTSSI